jgi:phosphate transport system substrate-binding protein
VLSICTLAACAGAPAPAFTPTPSPLPPIVLAGSTAGSPLLHALEQAFQVQTSAKTIWPGFDGAASTAYLQNALLEGGTLDLAAIGGAPLGDLWSAPIAVDALAVIVHPDNPLTGLTLAQLQQVFSGRLWHWSELVADTSFAGAEIVVVSREVGSGTRAAFVEQVLRERPGQRPTPLTKTALLRFSSADVVAYVAEHPAAIGYLALGALQAAPPAAAVKVLAIEDVVPEPTHVSSGVYPLSLPIYLVARSEPSGAARQFLDFCLSPQGQRIVARQYVPVRE